MANFGVVVFLRYRKVEDLEVVATYSSHCILFKLALHFILHITSFAQRYAEDLQIQSFTFKRESTKTLNPGLHAAMRMVYPLCHLDI